MRAGIWLAVVLASGLFAATSTAKQERLFLVASDFDAALAAPAPKVAQDLEARPETAKHRWLPPASDAELLAHLRSHIEKR